MNVGYKFHLFCVTIIAETKWRCIMLRTELNMYNRELEGVKAEIKTAPPGRLIRRKAVYTHLINNKETGITNNKDIIQKLCRKKYLMIREKQLNKNISVISKASTKIDDSEADEIIESLSAPYSGLPKAYFCTSF